MSKKHKKRTEKRLNTRIEQRKSQDAMKLKDPVETLRDRLQAAKDSKVRHYQHILTSYLLESSLDTKSWKVSTFKTTLAPPSPPPHFRKCKEIVKKKKHLRSLLPSQFCCTNNSGYKNCSLGWPVYSDKF